ncbi:MAG TPA: hypothetical protein VFM25_04960 [Verrucomicrobiae bacterium]|nr:hypothetical protein [Verrucomicrobiae bacterium]
MPAAIGTNQTFFVHSNIVQNPVCDGGAFEMMSLNEATAESAPQPDVPMAIRADGTGSAVPLALYPEGFDLSDFVIFDPATGESVSGAGYSRISPLDGDIPLPEGGEGAGDSTNTPPETGFYRVVRNGIHIFGLTNDTVLSGILKIPVEAGNDQGILSSITLSANDNPIPGTSMMSQEFSEPIEGLPAVTNTPLAGLNFILDTRRVSNGDYYLQAHGQWVWSSTNAYDVPYVRVDSPSILVHITNEISFPDWVQEFRDDLMLIKVTSAVTNTDWQVDVYGSEEDYVGSFIGHTDDGLIDIPWNLHDPYGNPRTDSTFTTVTTITNSATASSATQVNPNLIHIVDNYPTEGMWLIARADYIPPNAQNYSTYVSIQDGFAVIGEGGGGVLPGLPYRSAGTALFINNVTNVGAFARALTNHLVRNFYFDGHGSPDFIGYFPDATGAKRPITASTVAKLLGNDPPSTNSIRYRWVWIDSCQSALGDWPQAFGMGNRENVALADYVSRPATFCGFTHEVYGFTAFHGISSIDISSISFRSYFQVFWSVYGDTIKNAFSEAEFYSGDHDDPQYLKIYGYWGLHWNEFNSKSEWPPSP